MNTLLAIVGATGTGKSALALDLAEALAAEGRGAEIVNADAMQLYRGMDIGTAKVPVAERRGVPHHLLDMLEPSEEASVAAYQREARAAVEAIQTRGAVPILVGGSGLYVSSVIQDFAFPGRDAEVRARLEAELAAEGASALHARLAAADPAAAARVDPANGRRVVRALEVVELEGSFRPGLPEDREPWQRAAVVMLELPRDRLVPRLDARVERMWADGLLDEANALRSGPGLGVTAARAIGYAQAIAQLDGAATQAEAIAETQFLTRRYARRQVSWFRRYRDAARVPADAAPGDRVAAALALIA
ncbi:MAG: tRNA (adenosine(37)-N6)-dimethylallyltransferase MiaA [Microbacteriaceae bacterium]|nr:tRNA (adenosine(37)-N6)-dimethylallyltransferase MiaA [Microbacteriaceae bacterium]